MPADKVTVAYVHPNEISSNFHASLIGMLMWDAAHDGHLLHDTGQLAVRYGDSLPAARNMAAAAFLQSDAEWLLWVDSDMGFSPESLDVLLAVADKKTRPVVGGLCFASREYAKDGMGGHRVYPRPTIYRYQEHEGSMQFVGVTHYPVNRLVRCEATGSAFVLIHRDVLEKIGGDWYTRLTGDSGKLLGEDISFCVRVQAAGYPLYVHTGCRVTHQKTWWVSEIDWWDQYVAPPADERVAVVVPVMRRPLNAAPFMRSLRASTGLATVYAVCDPDDNDTHNAWLDAGAEVVVSDNGHTFAQKANCAYRKTSEPWLFLCGDDVVFRPGWYDQALHVARMDKAQVVATNDLGNEAVMAGVHATHPLIARRYVDELGASWDGPGVVVHEGYRHWFCDNEWTVVAQQRGVFASALGSKVEHMHPMWGKNETDATYRKGQTHADRDRRLWERRLKEHS